ncbi:MAG: thioesterase family protein [Oscillospiraceae bacterium]
MNEIKVGTTFEKEITVTKNLLAVNVGSGDVSVFATPMMLSLMEEVSAKCLAEFLDEGMTSVGTSITASHVAATPVGMKVKACAQITTVEGKKVSFTITASDEKGVIGEGTHNRFIVDREKFNQKALAKLS